MYEMNSRSQEVLRRLVEEFMQTGQPVGSRTLSRRLQTPVSPATIRNVMADLEDSFVTFTGQVEPNGCVVACTDDRRLRRLLQRIHCEVVSYGVEDASAQLFAHDVTLCPSGSRSQIRVSGNNFETEIELQLAVPGRHNVQNALAAVSVGLKLDVSPETVVSALAKFRGADRRLQVCGEINGIVVVDDYGHHPTEIAAVIETCLLYTSPSPRD